MPKGLHYKKDSLTQICYNCHIEKSKNDFYKKKSSASGYRYECKSCSYLLRKNSKLKNPTMTKYYCRNNNLKRKFKITIEDYNNLLAQQNYKCKICGSFKTYSKHNVFHVDHNHLTGKVRGLLCNNCNLALGNFQDNIANLKAAISYLEYNFPKSAEQLEFSFIKNL